MSRHASRRGESPPAAGVGASLLCRKEWTQLNYGWWTVLEPHLKPSYRKEAQAVRQQARQDLEDETIAMAAKLRKIRGQQ